LDWALGSATSIPPSAQTLGEYRSAPTTCTDFVADRDIDRLHSSAVTVAGLRRNDIAAVTAQQMMAATLHALGDC
jgi:hypothetical protein